MGCWCSSCRCCHRSCCSCYPWCSCCCYDSEDSEELSGEHVKPPNLGPKDTTGVQTVTAKITGKRPNQNPVTNSSSRATRNSETGSQSDTQHLPRFCKFSISDGNPLDLIAGYLDEPLSTLEEALRPFHGEINHLTANIKKAKADCYFPSKHKLTRDESAALYIYTMTWKKTCVYDLLEETWKSGNSSKMKLWLKYLRLFKSALDKLPKIHGEVWQGEYYNTDLVKKLQSDPDMFFSSLGLCSRCPQDVKDSLRKGASDKILLIGYSSVDVKSIAEYSFEKSALYAIWPGTKLGINNLKGWLAAHDLELQQSMAHDSSNVTEVYPSIKTGKITWLDPDKLGIILLHIRGPSSK